MYRTVVVGLLALCCCACNKKPDLIITATLPDGTVLTTRTHVNSQGQEVGTGTQVASYNGTSEKLTINSGMSSPSAGTATLNGYFMTVKGAINFTLTATVTPGTQTGTVTITYYPGSQAMSNGLTTGTVGPVTGTVIFQ